MAERELLVRILGDDRDLQRTLDRTGRSVKQIDERTQSFGRNVGRAFAAVGISVGVAETFDLLRLSVNQASALNEEISKSEQVFGDASVTVRDWAKTTADSLGISELAALQATGTFGNLFATIGTAPEQAAAMSQALVQLAADLASFNNANPEDVLNAIRSGLIGEAEPLRRYGVLLSEARVQQLALATTGKATTKELTNQEKALARYEIILQDTTTAQGDFARTQNSLANQTRILEANMANLAATIGGKLEPAVLHLITSTNQLFNLFQEDHEIQLDAAGAEEEIARLEARIASLGRGAVGLQIELQQTIDMLRKIAAPRPDDRSGLRGPGAIAITNAQVDAQEAERAAAKARAAQARRQKAFDEFVKGQGLKLDQSELTRGLEDDLEVLRAIEAAIQRRIKSEGRTFKLVDQLTAVRLEIASTVERQADDAKQAGQDAFDATIDALNLELEVAQATQSLEDDQAALRAIERAILNRIQGEGETTDLLRQLFQVREEQEDVARRLNEQRQRRRQSKQFEALGLTEEGEERVPSTASLRRRRASLEEQIKGTALDTAQNRQILENAQRVLSEKFGKVGREVRSAIEGMFDDIADGFKSGDEKLGPLTKTTSLNTKKFLEGLGLSEEEVRALRGRLSSFNSAGAAPAGFLSPGVNVPSGGFGGVPIVVESNVTVTLDGKKVGQSVTKEQQKARRRNPRQKRGPNRRGGEG